MSRAICILIDKHSKTIGARLDINGKVGNFNTETLSSIAKTVKLDNAVIDKNGFIRGKNGVILKKITLVEKPNVIQYREQGDAAKLLKSKELILYHGSREKKVVPVYGVGRENNDYGRGFYTTANKELAKEWAWSVYAKGDKAYLHTYKINIDGLNILDLTKFDSIHWIAELLTYRPINIEQKEVFIDRYKDEFLNNYKLDTSDYDIIIGYRADDSYFTYATDFVMNRIYKETLENALRFGYLGLQIFIKSKKAFEMLNYTSVEEVDIKYMEKFKKRDMIARKEYAKARENNKSAREKITFTDVMEGRNGRS